MVNNHQRTRICTDENQIRAWGKKEISSLDFNTPTNTSSSYTNTNIPKNHAGPNHEIDKDNETTILETESLPSSHPPIETRKVKTTNKSKMKTKTKPKEKKCVRIENPRIAEPGDEGRRIWE
jgi:hypothetical protein